MCVGPGMSYKLWQFSQYLDAHCRKCHLFPEIRNNGDQIIKIILPFPAWLNSQPRIGSMVAHQDPVTGVLVYFQVGEVAKTDFRTNSSPDMVLTDDESAETVCDLYFSAPTVASVTKYVMHLYPEATQSQNGLLSYFKVSGVKFTLEPLVSGVVMFCSRYVENQSVDSYSRLKTLIETALTDMPSTHPRPSTPGHFDADLGDRVQTLETRMSKIEGQLIRLTNIVTALHQRTK